MSVVVVDSYGDNRMGVRGEMTIANTEMIIVHVAIFITTFLLNLYKSVIIRIEYGKSRGIYSSAYG